MKKIFFLSILAAASFKSIEAQAQSSTQTSIHHHYQSPRPLGMGDAFVAVANDYNALMYNPAGLARIEEGQMNLSIDVGGSKNAPPFSTDASKAAATTGSDAEKIVAYLALFDKYYGQHISTRMGLLESVWVRPHWGIALIPADVTLDMDIHKTVGPTLDIKTYIDTTFAYGYGSDIKGVPGRLSWGITGKFINRGFASKQLTPIDLAVDSTLVSTADLLEGYTGDADLGLLYTPFLPSEGFFSMIRMAKPTFGLVVRNAADIGFGQSLKILNKSKTAAPERLYRVLDVGTKFELPQFWIFSSRAAIDVRDMGHPNFSTRKSLHAGLEFDWRVASWWKGSYRMGVNQGYPTFGVSALFTYFNLDVVTYGEDVGSADAPKENRVYMAKFNLDI